MSHFIESLKFLEITKKVSQFWCNSKFQLYFCLDGWELSGGDICTKRVLSLTCSQKEPSESQKSTPLTSTPSRGLTLHCIYCKTITLLVEVFNWVFLALWRLTLTTGHNKNGKNVFWRPCMLPRVCKIVIENKRASKCNFNVWNGANFCLMQGHANDLMWPNVWHIYFKNLCEWDKFLT